MVEKIGLVKEQKMVGLELVGRTRRRSQGHPGSHGKDGGERGLPPKSLTPCGGDPRAGWVCTKHPKSLYSAPVP